MVAETAKIAAKATNTTSTVLHRRFMGLPSLGEIWTWLETTREGGRALGSGELVQWTENRPCALLRGAQFDRNVE